MVSMNTINKKTENIVDQQLALLVIDEQLAENMASRVSLLQSFLGIRTFVWWYNIDSLLEGGMEPRRVWFSCREARCHNIGTAKQGYHTRYSI